MRYCIISVCVSIYVYMLSLFTCEVYRIDTAWPASDKSDKLDRQVRVGLDESSNGKPWKSKDYILTGSSKGSSLSGPLKTILFIPRERI